MANVNMDYSGTTSSEYYEIGMTIAYSNLASNNTHCTATIQPYLRRIKSNVVRKQHYWNVYFYLDGNVYSSAQRILPDDDAQAGVVGAGELTMVAGNWYKWGPPYTITLKNDGSSHTFGLRMECGTVPRQCPDPQSIYGSVLTSSTLWTTVYSVPAPPPTGLSVDYDKKTRKALFYWDAADCSYITLGYSTFDAAGKYVTQSGFLSKRTDNKVYNEDCPLEYTIPDNVVTLSWYMTNYSSTGHQRGESGPRLDIEANVDPKVYVYDNTTGSFRKTIPWVKTDSGWKKAIPWVKKPDGSWTKTIT